MRLRISSTELFDAASFVERTARLALVTRLARLRIKAVYRLSEDAGTGGLTDTSWTTKEIGVGKLSALYGILKC